ncbi:MAG: amino acid permease [Pirellulales bacterium]|jgi:amino acid transporter|nr:amino acid permease [Thermoguttaceae bacterium]MDD4789359.1 amino acid permease [Pirellulales bacterium]NLZ03499.1 amino acid permease [Pirellulaceae bacterium]
MRRSQFFAKKSLEVLLEEMAGEHRLRRVLGPVALSSLGIGAIIGTGIFVLTGLAARQFAGPALVISFVIAGLACACAALCYAEFASMAPIAGSAYTYAYVSLGELAAWIIGWDLVLEYAMASATVASGWSHYFLGFLGLFKLKTGEAILTIPMWLSMDPFTASTQHIDYQTAKTLAIVSAEAMPLNAPGQPQGGEGPRTLALPVAEEAGIHRVARVGVQFSPESIAAVEQLHGRHATPSIDRVQSALESRLQYDPVVEPQEMLDRVRDDNQGGARAYQETPLVLGGLHLTINVVALAICAVITTVLVIGIRESAGVNAVMVLVKIGAVLFVVVLGIGYVDTANWKPFMPYGWTGVFSGAALIFFAYVGFDSVSTHAEEARNPRTDVPIGILSSLVVCTILYIAVAAVVTGMVPYPQIPLHAPIAGVFEIYGLKAATVIITIGALTGITSVLLVMLLSQPRVLLAMARDGLLPPSVFSAVHPRFRTPHRSTILTGAVCGLTAAMFPLEAIGHMVNIGTLFAFVVVCASVWLMRRISPGADRPFRTPMLNLVAPAGVLLCVGLMVYLGWQNWVRLLAWLALGLVIYFAYGRKHSHLGKELREELARHGVSPAGAPLGGAPLDGEAAGPPDDAP